MTKSLTEMPTHSDNLYAERSFKNLLRFTGDTKKEHKADYNIVYDLLKVPMLDFSFEKKSKKPYCHLTLAILVMRLRAASYIISVKHFVFQCLSKAEESVIPIYFLSIKTWKFL